MVDVNKMIKELRDELTLVNSAIRSMENLKHLRTGRTGRRPGRPTGSKNKVKQELKSELSS